MPDSIIEIQNLSKRYGDLVAVNNISLQVTRGEILGLLGPNGAGKTTTISMLTGLLSPDEGSIEIDGMDMAKKTKEVKARIGLVPQDLALYPTLSARKNLQFFGRIYGLRGAELKTRIEEVLEMVKLSDRADDAVSKFSGGMKRRINIAAGLLHKPAVLFLDEPTVGVDPQSRNAIFEGVETLNSAGMTIIYTTHYMEEAQRLCDRVAIVDSGRIISLGTPTELIRGLGGGIIVVGIDDANRDAVLTHVDQSPSVKKITETDGKLTVETIHLQKALLGILDFTNSINARIESLELLEPNLESVFLHLTGKSLRE